MDCEIADNSVKIFIGNIIHCEKPFTVVKKENGIIIIKGSKILEFGDASEKEELLKKHDCAGVHKEVRLSPEQFLMPGMIDTHIHAPQYPNVGLGYDKQLLDWLNEYTYKLESRYSDLEFSKKVYDAIVQKAVRFGTTTACYFGSMYLKSSQILVDSVVKNGQRALVGKVNMTKCAPDNYIESPEQSLQDTETFINYVRSLKKNTVQPIITPRFALSLDLETMTQLGQLASKYDCHIQTHIAENPTEVKTVEDIFSCSYASVYEKAGLLTRKTILAHACYLSLSEIKLLASKGTCIAHCPSSNTRLQSGLCDVRRLIDNNLNVGLGTDISGGDSVSIIDAMRRALDVSIHLSFKEANYTPLNHHDVFYLATLGGAKALNLEENIGNFESGKDFDAVLVDMKTENSSCDYINDCDIEELLQKFIYTGDDRNVKNVYVAGIQIK